MKIAVIPNKAKEGAECLAKTILCEFPENCFLIENYECTEVFDAL